MSYAHILYPASWMNCSRTVRADALLVMVAWLAFAPLVGVVALVSSGVVAVKRYPRVHLVAQRAV